MSANPRHRDLPRRAPHVVARRLGDVGVLVNLQTNDIFELNDTGMRAWELLDEATTFNDLVAALVAEFDATDAVVAAEVRALLQQCSARGVVL